MRDSIYTLVALIAIFNTGVAVRCYSGREGSSLTTGCPFSCTKTTLTYDTTSLLSGSCWSYWQEEGCSVWTMVVVRHETCYCNTHFCNTAPVTPTLFLPLLLLSLYLVFLL